jgi:hypothetical protein
VGKGDGGGDQHDGVDGRRGQQEGEGGGGGDPLVDQAACDGDRPALAAGQGDARGGRGGHRQRGPAGEQPRQRPGRHVGGHRGADRDAERQERHGLDGDGHEDRRPVGHRRVVEQAGEQRSGDRGRDHHGSDHDHAQVAPLGVADIRSAAGLRAGGGGRTGRTRHRALVGGRAHHPRRA